MQSNTLFLKTEKGYTSFYIQNYEQLKKLYIRNKFIYLLFLSKIFTQNIFEGNHGKPNTKIKK